MAESFGVRVLVVLGMALGFCCLLAALLEQFRITFQGFIAMWYSPLAEIASYLKNKAQGLKAWITAQLKAECTEPSDSPVYLIIGAVLYTLMFAVFAYCDFSLLVLTLAAWGMDMPKFQLPEAATMTAAALILISFFWGAIFADASGWTHLTPYLKKAGKTTKAVMKFLAVLIVLICMLMGGAMAVWRQDSLLKNMTPLEASDVAAGQENLITVDGSANVKPALPDNMVKSPENSASAQHQDGLGRFSDMAFLIVPAGITALCFISTFFAGIQCHHLLKYLLLAVVGIGGAVTILPVLFVFWLTTRLISGLNAFGRLVIDLLASIGAIVLRPFGWKDASNNNQRTTAQDSRFAPSGGTGDNDPRDGKNQNPGAQQKTDESKPTGTAQDMGFNPFGRRS